MAETATTTRLVLAELLGLTATIEKHSEVVIKRMNAALRNNPGDGRNRVEHIHDPVSDIEEITLELNPKANAVFLKQARVMYEAQLLDPTVAQPLNLYSYKPNSTIIDQIPLMQAVIQSIHLPGGDANAHGIATAKIVVQPVSPGL